MITKIFDTENELNIRLRNLLFDIMLTIEILVVIIDKSDYHIGFESYIFRLTFLISLVITALAIKSFNQKELIVSAFLMIVSVISYKISGRNECLRFLFFTLSLKNLDILKKLKIFFYETLAGSMVLVLLSVTGIFGAVSKVTQDDGALHYTFGMGDPNAFHCMMLMLCSMFLYLYADKLKLRHYAELFFINIMIFYFTASKTAFALMAVLIAATYLVCNISFFKKKWIYIVGIASYIFDIAFSVWAAQQSKYCWGAIDLVDRVDKILTGRITNLYWDNAKHAGAIESWRIFSERDTEIYFDMGWCRLIYWYGIIPAAIIIILILLLYTKCIKNKNAKLIVLLSVLSLYTVVEAHLVSVYIGRNFILFFLAMYLMTPRIRRDLTYHEQ